MSTRFNSNHNKPHILNQTAKQRVMFDFKNIREKMDDIHQEKIHPGPDPSVPEFLKNAFD